VESVEQREERIARLERARGARGCESRALVRGVNVPESFFGAVAGAPVAVDSARGALALSEVYSCVRLLSQTARTLPLHAYRRREQGRTRVQAALQDHPAPGMAPGVLVSWMVASLALHGEFFAGKYRGADERVAMLSLLDPAAVTVEVGPDGEPAYGTTDKHGRARVLGRRDVIHGRLWAVDGLRGVSPFRACATTLGLAGSLARHAADTAQGGFRPDGVVTVQAGPGAEEVAGNLRAAWEQRHARPGRTAFVTSEVSYVPISLPAADAQLVEQVMWSAGSVARVFGIPPWMLGLPSGDSLTYATVEGQAQAFATFSLSPYLAAIEEALSLDGDVLPPGDTYAQFSLEGLLRIQPVTGSRAAV